MENGNTVSDALVDENGKASSYTTSTNYLNVGWNLFKTEYLRMTEFHGRIVSVVNMSNDINDITTLASYARHGSEWILSSQCNTW